MGIRTGAELLQSLRDGRQLFIDGERVGDVTTDPRFAAAAQSLAELYQMQHDPVLIDRMTFRSPTSGERVGLSFIEPHSVEDLVRRRDMVKVWMDATCGMFGRSPDFMNIFFTGFASAADEFGKNDKRFAENVRAYHAHIREHDICLRTPWSIRRSTARARSRSRTRTSQRRSSRKPTPASSFAAPAWYPPCAPMRMICWSCLRPTSLTARRPSLTPSASA